MDAPVLPSFSVRAAVVDYNLIIDQYPTSVITARGEAVPVDVY